METKSKIIIGSFIGSIVIVLLLLLVPGYTVLSDLINPDKPLPLNDKVLYSNENLTVTIKDDLGTELGNLTLTSHKTVDEIRHVGLGKQVLMWYEFDFEDLYLNGIGEITFIDMNTKEKIIRRYNLVYWGEIIEYQSICVKQGTRLEGCLERKEVQVIKEGWIEYNSKDIPKGIIIIGVEVEMKMDETIDVIWEIAGNKVEKHAVVSSGAITSYYVVGGNNYTVLKYLNDGSFNTTSDEDIEILIIAGGAGGGGENHAGGGGAGGFMYVNHSLTAGNYNIIIGLGGAGGTAGNQGLNGGNSTFDTLIAVGGGGGGALNTGTGYGTAGGSGGGGRGDGSHAGGAGVAGQGYAGGTGGVPAPYGGGGGGGAGETGDNAGGAGGDGGDGNTSTILNGTALWYGGGGGGSAYSGTPGNGGLGGGGLGGTNSVVPNDAVNNTGSGGGGSERASPSIGGDGGTGIVIIRYLPTAPTYVFFNITGIVKFSNGTLVNNADVFAVWQHNNSVAKNTTTNSTGGWVLEGMTNSTYIITGYDPTNASINGNTEAHVKLNV